MAQKKITASVISDLTSDQRVIRICKTLQQMGFEVEVIARSFNNSLPLGNYPFKATRIKCHFKKGILQYSEFNLKLFFKLLFCKTDYFLSNDLDTLVPNYMVSKFRSKKIFYDTHEYFTGVPELTNSPTKKKIWKLFEDWIFPKLPVVYTVNDSVKNLYESEYKNKISVVKNVTETTAIVAKEKPESWENKTILMMQGAGINEGRGGLELLEAMKYLPNNFLLVYIGSGTLWQTIKQKIQEWGLDSRVVMIDKLPPEELKKYTPLASIAFSLDSFVSLNYLYNLPNKIFDYIHAGIPCIATAIPEIEAIYKEYECGICIKECTPKGIAEAVLQLSNNKTLYSTLQQNCITASKVFCWENEKQKLIDLYQPYL